MSLNLFLRSLARLTARQLPCVLIASLATPVMTACRPQLGELTIGTEKMGEINVSYCEIPTTGWIRQGYPHIEGSLRANCDTQGNVDVSVVAPEESRISGTISKPFQIGEATAFCTPPFLQPKTKHADVVIKVGATCGGRYVSTRARCTMPW